MDDLSLATGWCVFTAGALTGTVLAGDSPSAAEKTVRRAVQDGILIRLCKGVFAYKYAMHGHNVLHEAALRLRPRTFSYASLETALSDWGVIDQETLGGVTVMTGGRSGRFKTPFGHIELTHTARSFAEVASWLIMPSGSVPELATAHPRLAARDLMRVGRSTDLIDWDVLDDVCREIAA